MVSPNDGFTTDITMTNIWLLGLGNAWGSQYIIVNGTIDGYAQTLLISVINDRYQPSFSNHHHPNN